MPPMQPMRRKADRYTARLAQEGRIKKPRTSGRSDAGQACGAPAGGVERGSLSVTRLLVRNVVAGIPEIVDMRRGGLEGLK
jgi:hypothetical protein